MVEPPPCRSTSGNPSPVDLVIKRKAVKGGIMPGRRGSSRKHRRGAKRLKKSPGDQLS